MANLSNKPTQSTQEDSVVSDINKLKSLLEELKQRVKAILRPVVPKKGNAKTPGSLLSMKKLLGKSILKKFVKVFLVILFLLILVIVGIRIFKTVKQNGNGGSGEGPFSEPSPTPAAYQSYEPSIWANDPEVQRLEEDINILEREMSQARLRENIIVLPNFDFVVSF